MIDYLVIILAVDIEDKNEVGCCMTDRFSGHFGSCSLGSVLTAILVERIKVPLCLNKLIHVTLVYLAYHRFLDW